MELGHLVVDHVTDGEVAGEHLEEHERRLDAVDRPLQGQDHGGLVEEQEEDERSLEEDRQHPEPSELRHLEPKKFKFNINNIGLNNTEIPKLINNS